MRLLVGSSIQAAFFDGCWLNLNYFQACGTKYIERCYLKENTIQDLQKAAHFIQKLIEIEESYDFVDKVLNMETDDSYHEGGADGSYVNQDQPDLFHCEKS
jgi:hypothetical protein